MDIKLIAFDLDGTLAPSKGPISSEMAEALKALLDYVSVCIISGGTKQQILEQVVSYLPKDTDLRNLHIMPTSGAQYYRRVLGRWRQIYSEDFTEEQVTKVISNIEVAAELLGYWPENPYGDVIENRGSQITFSALGQDAPRELKETWDPSGEKRDKLRRSLSALMVEFDVRSGGSTSVDVTRTGIDKGFGIYELSKRTFIKRENILFVGDRLDVGGNDYSVRRTGVDCVSVDSPEETLKLIKQLIGQA
jgi:HAD superfamily hydrolase (TIGR01484 family)